jgi:hypothetical protein
VEIEEVAEQFGDAAERTVADQDEGEDELADPGLGDREVEEDAVASGGWVVGEGVVERLLGLVGLVVDELAADLVLLGELRERCGVGESVEGQLLSLGPCESFGGAVSRSVEGLRDVKECMMSEHVCFLLRLGFVDATSVGRKQAA